jgi:hypothetical protein
MSGSAFGNEQNHTGQQRSTALWCRLQLVHDDAECLFPVEEDIQRKV